MSASAPARPTASRPSPALMPTKRVLKVTPLSPEAQAATAQAAPTK